MKSSHCNKTYEQCRDYSCNDIANNLTRISDDSSFITELPPGTNFNFLIRVDTSSYYSYNPSYYFQSFKKRNYISFSTINNKNISHYKYRGRTLLLAYDVTPDTIVHVFPIDSDIKTDAKSEEELTLFPSLWLTLKELNSLTLKLRTYNQITCKTKINGNIIKPFGVICFDKVDDYAIEVAKNFGIKCIIVHPDTNALHYSADVYYDFPTTREASYIMEEMYEINLTSHLYYD